MKNKLLKFTSESQAKSVLAALPVFNEDGSFIPISSKLLLVTVVTQEAIFDQETFEIISKEQVLPEFYVIIKCEPDLYEDYAISGVEAIRFSRIWSGDDPVEFILGD